MLLVRGYLTSKTEQRDSTSANTKDIDQLYGNANIFSGVQEFIRDIIHTGTPWTPLPPPPPPMPHPPSPHLHGLAYYVLYLFLRSTPPEGRTELVCMCLFSEICCFLDNVYIYYCCSCKITKYITLVMHYRDYSQYLAVS